MRKDINKQRTLVSLCVCVCLYFFVITLCPISKLYKPFALILKQN